MSKQLTYSIVADGGTDRLLVPIIQWAIHRLDPDVQIFEPEFCKRSGSIKDFFSDYDSSTMLTFCHRDAENLPLVERLKEFESISNQPNIVPIIPVRMSESWILFNSTAIAKAAGSPSSQVLVPKTVDIEGIADPKNHLDELLFEAAGSPTGRRGKKFKNSIRQRRVSVASYISDYSPLEDLYAFRRFQSSLADKYPYRA